MAVMTFMGRCAAKQSTIQISQSTLAEEIVCYLYMRAKSANVTDMLAGNIDEKFNIWMHPVSSCTSIV